MSWTTPAELRAQVLKLWRKGALLADMLDEECMFPLRLRLAGPNSAALTQRFDEVRDWIAELRKAEQHGYRIVWRGVKHRVIGQNELPDEIWIDTRELAIRIAGKSSDAASFTTVLRETRERHPELLSWLARYPLKALKHARDWPLLLDIIGWLKDNPRPGIYLRQLDLPGVHSKFIESHRSLLSELLDLSLPTRAIDSHATGTRNFGQRYGFRDKPARVRFRYLDSQTPGFDARLGADISISAEAFATLAPELDQVFITENEINYLAFPRLAASMVIFGAGYGFDALAPASWLASRKLLYWGDIDTHGFAILDQLRAIFPATLSFLMDRDTLLAHQALWGHEPKPHQRELTRLDEAERQLYDDLRFNRLAETLRLEQEKIAYHCLQDALRRLNQRSLNS